MTNKCEIKKYNVTEKEKKKEILIHSLNSQQEQGVFYVETTSLNTPTIICKHMYVLLAFIPLLYNINILMKALTWLITHITKIKRKVVEVNKG